MSVQPEPLPPTQVAHPWRATVRTIFAAVVGFAPMAPVIYQAATQQDPAQATGVVAGGLVVAGGVTRVMALPGVDAWLKKFVPFLAATPKG